jgi:putative acetyltransferase
MIIRPETTLDYIAIREINIAAFADQPFSQQTEHLIVEALRAADALTISLVAETERRVVGHIAFSPVTIEGQNRSWFALGPIGVLPSMQRQGIGSKLVNRGLDCLRNLSAEGCVLVGAPSYYGRFGFRRCSELVVDGFPPEVFLCLPLTGHTPRGRVEHHPAFS